MPLVRRTDVVRKAFNPEGGICQMGSYENLVNTIVRVILEGGNTLFFRLFHTEAYIEAAKLAGAIVRGIS